MGESNENLLKSIRHYQDSLNKYTASKNNSKILHYLGRLYKLPIKVSHLEETGIGRTVNALRKLGGEVGDAAKSLVAKWKEMVVEEEDNSEDTHQESTNACSSDNNSSSEDVGSKVEHYSNEKKSERSPSHKSSDNVESASEKYVKKNKHRDERKNGESSHSSKQDKDKKSFENKDKREKRKKSCDTDEDNSDSEEEQSRKMSKSKRQRHSSESSEDYSNNKKHKSKKSRYSHDDSDYESKSEEEPCHSKPKKSKHSTKESCSTSESKSSKSKHSSSESKPKHSSESSKSKKSSSSNHDEPKVKSDKHKSDHSSSKSSSSDKKDKHRKEEKSSKKDESSRKDVDDNHKKHKSSESSSSSKKDKSSNNKEHQESSSKSSSTKSKSSSSHEKSSKKSKSSSVSKEKIINGIDSGSGASFAEALGMCGPSSSAKVTTSKKKSSIPTSEKTSSSFTSDLHSSREKAEMEPPNTNRVPKLLKEISLEPLDINISSLLPSITPNYRPLGNVPIDELQKRSMTDDELSRVITSKNQRTKVYSGNKTGWGKVPTLFEMCTRILQDNLDALEYTGGVPYSILKPILEKANADQLYMMEHHNPYLIGETEELWQLHCQKEFRNKQREELETWRDMYMRCLDEREAKLKALTANIKQSQDKSIPVRTTKLAYVDSVVKPPRNIARKQAKNGTAFDNKRPAVTPSSRLSSLATAGDAGKVAVPNPGSRAAERSSNSAMQKPKKAPLMAKTLSLFKNRFRR